MNYATSEHVLFASGTFKTIKLKSNKPCFALLAGVNSAVNLRGKDATVEPTWIVLAACHRRVYTLGEPQAIDKTKAMVIGKLTQYQSSPMNQTQKRYLNLVIRQVTNWGLNFHLSPS